MAKKPHSATRHCYKKSGSSARSKPVPAKKMSMAVLLPGMYLRNKIYWFDPKMAVERFFDRWEVMSVNGRRPHLHMMRHSFASNRLLQGATVYLVAKWLGDDEDTTFGTYGHLQAADARINLGVGSRAVRAGVSNRRERWQ
jgi:integrase